MRGSQLHEWTHILAAECGFNALGIWAFLYFTVLLFLPLLGPSLSRAHFFHHFFQNLSLSLCLRFLSPVCVHVRVHVCVNVNMSITIHPIRKWAQSEKKKCAALLFVAFYLLVDFTLSLLIFRRCATNTQFHMHQHFFFRFGPIFIIIFPFDLSDHSSTQLQHNVISAHMLKYNLFGYCCRCCFTRRPEIATLVNVANRWFNLHTQSRSLAPVTDNYRLFGITAIFSEHIDTMSADVQLLYWHTHTLSECKLKRLST